MKAVSWPSISVGMAVLKVSKLIRNGTNGFKRRNSYSRSKNKLESRNERQFLLFKFSKRWFCYPNCAVMRVTHIYTHTHKIQTYVACDYIKDVSVYSPVLSNSTYTHTHTYTYTHTHTQNTHLCSIWLHQRLERLFTCVVK